MGTTTRRARTDRRGTPSGARGDPAKLRVRMYRQGLGDCFLLSFPNPSGAPAHVLVDCGTLGATCPPSVGMDEVVEDILRETGGHLSAVVATHEHEDHVSAFRTHADRFGAPEVRVDEVWLAWTEDASDPLAQELEKSRGDLLRAAALAAARLCAAGEGPGAPAAPLAALGAATADVLAFNGVAGPDAPAAKPKANEAMNRAQALGTPRFLSPGTVLERPWAPGVRFYVLGPPRDPRALKTLGAHGSPDLYDLSCALGADLAAAAGPVPDDAAGRDDLEQRLPFDALLRLEEADPAVRARCARSYDAPEEAWRRIDHEWLGCAAEFALQLDNCTNNTSLVLAIEVNGRVLLFPGDAQLGSWRSWQTVEFHVKDEGGRRRRVTAPDLLRRTVLYKVGHHASHNATATATGLELMESDDLVAFIPLDGGVAEHKRWPMPAENLYRRLLEKAHGRVLRSDAGWPDEAARPTSLAPQEWEAARADGRIDDSPELCVDLYLDVGRVAAPLPALGGVASGSSGSSGPRS